MSSDHIAHKSNTIHKLLLMDAFNESVLQYCVVEMEKALKLALLYSLAFVRFGGHFSLGVSFYYS